MQNRFANLNAAFQLHYYFCTHTKWNQPLFEDKMKERFDFHLREICEIEHYHLLNHSLYPNNVRLLLSLQPDDQLDRAATKIKANLARRMRLEFSQLADPHVWARGYLVRSVGRIQQETVERYITKQEEHHGYKNPDYVAAYQRKEPLPEFWSRSHVRYNLTYHIVLRTQFGKNMFDGVSGKAVIEEWLKVAAENEVILSRMKMMPSHAHLMAHLIPTMSVQACVQMLQNSSFELMNARFGGVIKLHEAWDVWEHSFYAGTLGSVTTAQVDHFLAGKS